MTVTEKAPYQKLTCETCGSRFNMKDLRLAIGRMDEVLIECPACDLRGRKKD